MGNISDKNTRFVITISKELKEAAEKKASEQDRSLSNYIVNLIKKDLKGDE